MHYHDDVPFETFAIPGNPAAGALFTVTSPAQEVWRLMTVKFHFVAAVAVANRLPWIRYRNSAAAIDVFHWEDAFAIISGQTADICFAAGVARNAAALPYLTFSLPTNIVLDIGTVVEFGCHAMNAGDQISGIIYTYLKWLV